MIPFTGSLINFACIVVFSVLGVLVGARLPERINRGVFAAIAVCVVYIGFDGAFAAAEDGVALDTFFGSEGLTKFIILLLSMSIGTLIGEAIDIDKWVNRLGEKIEKKFIKNSDSAKGNFSRGFVSCTIMTCVGAMAVNGAILDAQGNPDILIAKAVIDAVSCFIMATSLGIGCAFSAVPMLIYQGLITAVFLLAESIIPAATVYYLSATGSLIIIMIGTNFMGATNVKTANMTPAIFIPMILVPILQMF